MACSNPVWIVHTDTQIVQPTEGTVAIVVDVRKNKAAIRIIETETEEYIDGVGTEEAGKLVVIPWQSNWSYFCTGSPRVAYIL